MTARDQAIVDLLLQGAENSDIAHELHMAERTVKTHFNILFKAYGIKGGIKRVKLAVLFYRMQLRADEEKRRTESMSE
jgi:DNA-binding NarL/FixJ family response regulator